MVSDAAGELQKAPEGNYGDLMTRSKAIDIGCGTEPSPEPLSELGIKVMPWMLPVTWEDSQGNLADRVRVMRADFSRIFLLKKVSISW